MLFQTLSQQQNRYIGLSRTSLKVYVPIWHGYLTWSLDATRIKSAVTELNSAINHFCGPRFSIVYTTTYVLSYKSFFTSNYFDHRSDVLCKHHLLPLTQADDPIIGTKTEPTLQDILPIAEAKALNCSPRSFIVSQFFSLRKRCPKLYKGRCKKENVWCCYRLKS